MSELLDFLATNDISGITEEVKISKRIPHKFKIRPITTDEHGRFMKLSRKLKGKNIEFDDNVFKLNIVVAGTVEPDFSNIGFIEKLGNGVNTAKDAVSKVLLPGEIDELYLKIVRLSGFDDDINDTVDTAKN